ncbi:MAG TPA: Stk1 family PASTA domain-containing Ser/Thr kinase, partial [Rubrobacteraceae bacterium]
MQKTVLGDRYMLLEVLGAGGMAQVYLAHDNVLDREVALKVLREHYAHDEGFVERFRREAKNAAALNHPSIVQVYDRGRDKDGTYYMAMEYVPGGTLKNRICQGRPLEPREAARIGSRVAEALSVAHDRSIVHRDIKPQNVLLDASAEAKVADFGIARAANSETMTETNLVLGTTAYMSPEQLRGDRVGPASDLYSLGVVLYETLTGELPFRGGDPIATAMKHINEPAPHPREANPAVPETLDTLIVRLLAKEPEERYASAEELAEDLRRIRHGLPPLAAGLGERTTARIPQGIPHGIPQDSGRMRTAPTAVAPGSAPGSRSPGSRSPGSRSVAPVNLGFRRRALLRFVALLLGAVLLGGLAWTLSQAPSEQETPGVVGVRRVDVPDVVGLAGDKAMKRLDGAGLKPGSQDQAPNGEFAEGAVFEQDPEAGTETERGTVVDLVVSTGPAQELTPSASASASPTAPVSAPAPATTATAPATATPPATAPASPTRS